MSDSDVVELNVSEVKSLLEERKVLLLDNRDLESYKQGHIDGAMMAHEGLIESLINKGDKTVPVVVYCYQGASSMDVAKVFDSCGFKEVYSMIGGYAEWKRSA